MQETNLEKRYWTRSDTAQKLAEHFMKYCLQLFITYRENNEIKRQTCTGFLVYINDILLWLSAGHVISTVMSKSWGSGATLRWIDNWDCPGAETLPIHRRDFKYFLGDLENFDYGAIKLSILESENIRNNPKITPFKMRFGQTNTYAQVYDCYFLVGFPWENNSIESKPISHQKEYICLTTNLMCLPVKKILWEDVVSHDSNWSEQNAFYGQIMPYSDNDIAQPHELRGMSGGPIIGVRRFKDSFYVEVVGIFDSYGKQSRQIRGESIEKVLEQLERWLNAS